MYRELFVSPEGVASSGKKPASFYVVARLKAADVLALCVINIIDVKYAVLEQVIRDSRSNFHQLA